MLCIHSMLLYTYILLTCRISKYATSVNLGYISIHIYNLFVRIYVHIYIYVRISPSTSLRTLYNIHTGVSVERNTSLGLAGKKA